MDVKLAVLYFLVGGLMVALVSYFGSQDKGLLAAFIANLPTVTLITLCAIYISSGVAPAVSYFKSMILMLPVWLIYALSVIFLLPRLGLVPTILTGMSLYLAGAFITVKLVE